VELYLHSTNTLSWRSAQLKHTNLVENLKGRDHSGGSGRWEDNIKVYLKEMGCGLITSDSG
jgi:hypothetical protein